MDDQGKRIMTGPHGVDRRALRRNRVLKSALAAYNSQFTTMPCVMRNVSEDGARLEFDELARVPASFVLHVGIDGYQIGCERVWRDGKACGVKFTGEKSPSHFFHPQALGMSQAALDRHVEDAALHAFGEIVLA